MDPDLVRIGGRSHFSPADLAQLRRIAEKRVTASAAALAQAGMAVSRVLLCGSLATGLLDRPKPAAYSGSPTMPPRPNIIELDIRIILNPGHDPCAHDLLAVLSSATNGQLARSGPTIRWGRPTSMSVLYAHQAIGEHCALEWETCLNIEPYFESAPYWADIFSPGEIIGQRAQRSTLLRAGAAREDYEALKAQQGTEFRYRLAAALARVPDAELPAPLRRLIPDLGRFPAVQAAVEHARKSAPRHAQPRKDQQSQPTEPTPPRWTAYL